MACIGRVYDTIIQALRTLLIWSVLPKKETVNVYLTTFPVHLLYQVLDCISVGLTGVGVILSVKASVGVW